MWENITKGMFRYMSGKILIAGDDPLIALIRRGEGRYGIFASDCGPHWAPKEFTGWEHWPRLWGNFLNWLTDKQGVV